MPKTHPHPPGLFFQQRSVEAEPQHLENAGTWCSVENGCRAIDPSFRNPEVRERLEMNRRESHMHGLNAPPLLLSTRNYEQLCTEKIDGQNIQSILLRDAVLTLDDPWTELPVYTKVDAVIQVRTNCSKGDRLEVDTLRPMEEGIKRVHTWRFVDENERGAVEMDESDDEDEDAALLRARSRSEAERLRREMMDDRLESPAYPIEVEAPGEIGDSVRLAQTLTPDRATEDVGPELPALETTREPSTPFEALAEAASLLRREVLESLSVPTRPPAPRPHTPTRPSPLHNVVTIDTSTSDACSTTGVVAPVPKSAFPVAIVDPNNGLLTLPPHDPCPPSPPIDIDSSTDSDVCSPPPTTVSPLSLQVIPPLITVRRPTFSDISTSSSVSLSAELQYPEHVLPEPVSSSA